MKEQLEQVKNFNSHPLSNSETRKYNQNEPKFSGVYSKNNLPKIKDGPFTVNLDEYKSMGTYRITMYVNDNNVTYFDSFGVEHIPKQIWKFIGNKNVVTNIYRIQADDSIMCEYFCLDLLILCLKVKVY